MGDYNGEVIEPVPLCIHSLILKSHMIATLITSWEDSVLFNIIFKSICYLHRLLVCLSCWKRLSWTVDSK